MIQLTPEEIDMCNRWDNMSDKEFKILLTRCGINERNESEMSRNDKLDQIMEYIDEKRILTYKELCQMVRKNHPEWREMVYHEYPKLLRLYIGELGM